MFLFCPLIVNEYKIKSIVMKTIISFFIVFFLFCCVQKAEIESKSAKQNSNSSNIQDGNNKQGDFDLKDWNRREDSLRNEVAKTKPNKILKESFLQELYLKDVATVEDNMVLVKLPFDLHYPDCGAPDGYTTEVSFSLRLEEPMVFPETLPFREHEYGFVEKEFEINDNFILSEKTDRLVVYYCLKYKRTLVLFNGNRKYETSRSGAYYFSGLKRNAITDKVIDDIVYNCVEMDEVYCPFMNHKLSNPYCFLY
jgi:hypothetical protein